MSSNRPYIRALLIDISGTLHVGSNPTHNAIQALDMLRTSAIPFRFCSNLSKESTSDLQHRLVKMGFPKPDSTTISKSTQEIWTSLRVLKRRIYDLNIKNPYLLLSESARLEIEETDQREKETSAKMPYDAVVIGLAPSLFDYTCLNTAFRILVGEHEHQRITAPTTHESVVLPKRAIPLIATHKVKYFESASPPGLSLGPGPFVTALEYATGVKAEVIGKPSRAFLETVIKDLNLGDERQGGSVAIIGDDIEADLGDGAVELGLWRVLVRTGKYRPGDENKLESTPPDEIQDSFSPFVESLLATQFDNSMYQD